jgi:hypothetical protein
VVAVLAWFVDRRLGRALWLGVTATTLAGLAAALFMFVYVRTEAFASSFALIPYPSSELSPIFAEGGDVTGLQDTLMGSFRLAISFGLVWNALVFLAMIRNRISHAPPVRDKAVV